MFANILRHERMQAALPLIATIAVVGGALVYAFA